MYCTGLQKLCRGTGGPRRKVWTRTKFLIKIFHNLRTFWRPFGKKKCLFGSKTVFLGQEVHHYMIYIAYFIELILQICDYAQKRRICRESCKYALDKNFHGHFCPRRKAAKFCHPGIAYFGLNYLHFTLNLEIFSL